MSKDKHDRVHRKIDQYSYRLQL